MLKTSSSRADSVILTLISPISVVAMYVWHDGESAHLNLSIVVDRRRRVTNAAPQKEQKEKCGKIRAMDNSGITAENIRRTHNSERISLLFGDWTVRIICMCIWSKRKYRCGT
ncbi:hypothetical protein EDD17DRAFT_1648120 [Pisolithus thermaeus]|nr:hypothetical protein EDD17DRAFT_1648120 [Pisolithus thermaeus]